MQHVQLALAKMGMGAVGSREQNVCEQEWEFPMAPARYQSTRQRGERVEKALAARSLGLTHRRRTCVGRFRGAREGIAPSHARDAF